VVGCRIICRIGACSCILLVAAASLVSCGSSTVGGSGAAGKPEVGTSTTPTRAVPLTSDIAEARCTRLAAQLHLASPASTIVSIARIKTALTRAHSAMSPSFSEANEGATVALCEFDGTSTTLAPPPSTMCPNGDVAEVGPSNTAPLVVYAVGDAQPIRLPSLASTFPEVPVPSTGSDDPCAGLGAGTASTAS
jgi:hypothetical protein